MLLDQLKLIITTDSLPNYSKQLQVCTDYKGVGMVTKQLIENLVKVVFPGEELVLTAHKNPQDNKRNSDDSATSQNNDSIVKQTKVEATRFEQEYQTQLAMNESLLQAMSEERENLLKI